jgi:hypothetical protein
MKRKDLEVTMKTLLPVLVVAVALALSPGLATASGTAPTPTEPGTPETLSVDYVLGLMQAGMKPGLVVDLIREQDLHFRLATGDVERLRAAGASQALVEAVTARTVTLQNRATASQDQGRTGDDSAARPPTRPRRIGTQYSGAGAAEQGGTGASGEEVQGEGEQGPVISYGYDLWWPGYFGSFWYPPFYSYYYAPYAYGYPYVSYPYGYGGDYLRGPRGGHRGFGTHSWGGHHGGFGGGVRTLPRGSRGGGAGHGSPHRSPRGS